jgi:hypothetical protein
MSTHWSQNGRRYPPPKQPLIPLFSSRVYKYAKYLLSSPFRHSKADHLHPNSFFSRLPYDIRAIIYVYLEDDKNLLALSRYDSIGFMLSCRKAKEELNEDASRRLRYFLDEFARNTSLELKVQQCKCDPQVVTVQLPFAALNSLDSHSDARWKRKVLVGLHPLLSQYLNTLRIHFVCTEDCTPPHSTKIEKSKLEVNMHLILRHLGYMIDRVNVWHQFPPPNDQRRLELEQIFSEHAVTPYPDDQVKVKRICISWDLRNLTPGEDEPSTLKGTMDHARIFRACQKGRRRRLFPETRAHVVYIKKMLKENTFRPPDPYRWSLAMCYHLWDIEHLVGEMGIISPMRWQLGRTFAFLGVRHMIDGNDLERECDVSMTGLGSEIREGGRRWAL